MVWTEKPQSSKQRYRLTQRGVDLLGNLKR